MNATTAAKNTIDFITLDAAGQGKIQASDAQQARLEEVTQRVGSGEFHKATNGRIPCTCIDGRCGGTDGLMPNAAGGTETLMVADDLTTKRFAGAENASTCDQYRSLVASLQSAGQSVGGHTASDLHGAPSGCGANDKLAAIYAYIVANGDTLRHLATTLGYDVSDASHATIVANAQARTDFSDGSELLSALQDAGGRVDTLQGEHTEVVAVINRRAGTTLDRDAVQAEFGDDYEAFNVDEWAFAEGAAAISESADEHELYEKRVAMLYYNLATAGVLCGPGMRVVVLA